MKNYEKIFFYGRSDEFIPRNRIRNILLRFSERLRRISAMASQIISTTPVMRIIAGDAGGITQWSHPCTYCQISTVRATSQNLNVSRIALQLPLSNYWSQVLSCEWRCSWSSTDRRCSNYIWMINNIIAYLGAAYIRGLTVHWCMLPYPHGWCDLAGDVCDSNHRQMHDTQTKLRRMSVWNMIVTPGVSFTNKD